MKTGQSFWGAAAAAIAGAAVLWACHVSFPDGVKFSCATDGDCGPGYRCLAADAGSYCCEEGSAGCDALTDGGTDGGSDACGGADLTTDPANCGTCGHACAVGLTCRKGTCVNFAESICNDQIDNDLDDLTDCADPDCQDLSCGTGCQCKNLGKTEIACGDGLDNDSDTFIDCADPNCSLKSCGTGCACIYPNKTETVAYCSDGVDNDSDGLTDCRDTVDCVGASCGSTKKCLSDGGCG